MSSLMKDSETSSDEMDQLNTNRAQLDKPKDNVRSVWSNQIEFLLSCIGYAVGFGNIWRFPYLCMRNGGGAFLIPYFIFLFLCGVPLFFMELSLGQFSSLSPTKLWELCPLFKGLGWGMVILSGVVVTYVNVIMAWILYYLGLSFTKTLPWASCENAWNTDHCMTRGASTVNVTSLNTSTYSVAGMIYNATHVMSDTPVRPANFSSTVERSAAEEFWEFNVLQRSSGIEDFGGVRWELLLTLVIGALLVFACLIKGIKSSGKVVYVTATFPYICLTALLVRGLMLPGAVDGIIYYLKPDFNRLAQIDTWVEACLQIFYSLGVAWGGLITMSSYNRFRNNCLRDAVVISTMNCLTSFYAGFVVFAIIGFMANDAGVTVSEVITSGPGLVFVAYPEAISRMPLAPLWAVLFFLMLVTVGLDSMFASFETLISGIVDCYPKQLRSKKTLLTAACVAGSFLLQLPLVTKAGLYYFQIVDWYCAMFSATFIGCLECVVVAWIYGWRRFYKDIAMMLGHEPGQIWRILWCFVTPALMSATIIYSAFHMREPSYGDYTYPRWAIAFGWLTGIVSLVPLPVLAIRQLWQEQGTLWQRIRQSTRPSSEWGPGSAVDRLIYIDEPTRQQITKNGEIDLQNHPIVSV